MFVKLGLSSPKLGLLTYLSGSGLANSVERTLMPFPDHCLAQATETMHKMAAYLTLGSVRDAFDLHHIPYTQNRRGDQSTTFTANL